MSVNDTLMLILINKSSIVRFGDGEILYMTDKLDLTFQVFESDLVDYLTEILKNNNENLLVGLPLGYYKTRDLSIGGKVFWRSQIVWNYPRFKKFLNLHTTYANASITRVYYGYGNRNLSKMYFRLWQDILKVDSTIIVEGEKTRFGIGNDLLKNIQKVERILAPKHDAYKKVDTIYDYIINNHHKSVLILVALGPAAKALVYLLVNKGYRVLDVGNLDIEYEWYLTGTTEKVLIPGKYSFEVKGGIEVGEIPDLEARKEYQAQIIRRFI